jgi:hypothetical protein
VQREVEKGGDEVLVSFGERSGVLHPDLRIGANVAAAKPLRANSSLSCPGFKLHGAGFIVTPDVAAKFEIDAPVKEYRNGRDLADSPRGVKVIDLFGYSAEEVRRQWPRVYQHVLERVKPERDQNKRATYRDNWWIFGEPRGAFRPALKDLALYIATVETAKHRVFQFLDAGIAPDNMLIAIASDEASHLGVLSSVVHVIWALAAGGRLGIGNDPRYNKSRCFEPFPFPAASDEQFGRIRPLADQLDTHRKRQQAAHRDLTVTGMYNVLDKLRSGEPLTAKERTIHEHGLVSVLRQLHDDLDAAVLDAYGWSDLLPLLRIAHGNDTPAEGQTREEAKRAFDETILERLVALNAERAAEEARGHIRWLRPEFQNPQAHVAPEQPTPEQASFDTDTEEPETATSTPAITKPQPWPKDTIEQVRAVADLLAASPIPLSLDEIADRFTGRGPWKKRLPQLLEMLIALGRAHVSDQGRYAASR